MDYGLAGMAEGLNNAIQQYVGTATQKMQTDYKQAGELANRKAEIDYTQNAETQRQLTMEGAKHDTVQAGMLKKMNPYLAETLSAVPDETRFHTSDIPQLMAANPKASKLINGTHVGSKTFLTLLKHSGVPDDEVNSLAQDLQTQGNPDLPVGLAEGYLKGSQKETFGAAAIASLLKDDMGYSMLKTPEEKAKYAQRFEASLNGGGKLTIDDQQTLDAVTQKALTTYQFALAHPNKYKDPLIETAGVLGKKYNKYAVNQVITNLHALNEHGKTMPDQGAPQPPPQQ